MLSVVLEGFVLNVLTGCEEESHVGSMFGHDARAFLDPFTQDSQCSKAIICGLVFVSVDFEGMFNSCDYSLFW